MTLKAIAVILQAPLAPFELGVLHEVFGVDRTDDGVPAFTFTICTERPSVPVANGPIAVEVEHGLTGCAEADLVAVPGGPMPVGASAAVLACLRAATARGAFVLGMCSGAFTLAEAGVLNGRIAATHWRYADQFQAAFPDVEVDRDSLYRIEDSIVTSAGTAAGIDACLQLVRREHGPAIANRIARRMVVPPHRDGGQRQYVESPLPAGDTAGGLHHLLQWVDQRLGHAHTLASLANQAHMSSRSLSRRFQADLGTSPMTWLTQRRIFRAQELLEGTDMSVEQVASAAGFGSGTVFRHHFRQQVGITATAYRARFRDDAASA